MENVSTSTKSAKIIVGLLLVGLIIAVMASQTKLLNVQKQGPTPPPAGGPQPKTTLTLSTEGDRTTFGPGETIAVKISANSAGISITGYDVALPFNTDVMTFDRIENNWTDFDIYQNTLPIDLSHQRLIITGTKKLDVNNQIDFADIVVATAYFTVRRTDQKQESLALDFEKGSTDESNLIDQNNNDVLTGVQGINLYIGDAKTIRPTAVINADGSYVKNEIIVKYKDGGDPETLELKLQQQRAEQKTWLGFLKDLFHNIQITIFRNSEVDIAETLINMKQIDEQFQVIKKERLDKTGVDKTTYILTLASDVNPEDAVEVYKGQPGVEYAEPNYIYELH